MDIRKYKGVIFDLDGTLLDSMDVWNRVDIEFFENRNMQMPTDYQDNVKTMHFPTAAKYTKERFNLSDSIEEIMAEWTTLCLDAYKNEIKLKNGAFEFLHFLDENNIKISYATANSEILCEKCLKSNGVWDLFCARAYSEEVNKSKSEPDIYLLASERMNLKPQDCNVFEDLYEGIIGAKKGGFSTCGVSDKTNLISRNQIRKEADFYIDSFTELL